MAISCCLPGREADGLTDAVYEESDGGYCRRRLIVQFRSRSARRALQSGLTATLRNFTTPSPHCSVKRPSSKKPLFTSAVLVPLSVSVSCRLLAVISMVFHLPAALSFGLASAK